MADWFMEMVNENKKRKLEEENRKNLPPDGRSAAERIYGKKHNDGREDPVSEVMLLARADGVSPATEGTPTPNAAPAQPPKSGQPVAEAPVAPDTPTPPPAPTKPAAEKSDAKPANAQAQTNPKRAFDVDVFAKHLTDKAETESTGHCATYVKKALGIAGVDIKGAPEHAKDYGPFLENRGFQKINKENYIPQKGDIVVIQPYKEGKSGHVQGYTGTRWYSDFPQRPGDIYPGPDYRSKRPNYEIYR